MPFTVLVILAAMLLPMPQNRSRPRQTFVEGCCLNEKDFPHPKHAVGKKLERSILLSALNCATNNQFLGTSESLAHAMGTGDGLRIAYFYGRYLPEQGGDALTVGIYSKDDRRGSLFDIDWQEDGTFFVENIPDLLKRKNVWRVGEINGGFWSYTRLYYLAQDIGRMPKTLVPLSDVISHKPAACWVMVEKQWDNIAAHKRP